MSPDPNNPPLQNTQSVPTADLLFMDTPPEQPERRELTGELVSSSYKELQATDLLTDDFEPLNPRRMSVTEPAEVEGQPGTAGMLTGCSVFHEISN